MSKSVAPGMPWGCSWMWLWLVLVGALAPGLPAQTRSNPPAPKPQGSPGPAKDADRPTAKPGDAPTKPGDAAKKDKAESAKAAEIADQGITPSPETKKVPPAEIFKDPRVEKALPNTFPQVGSRPVQQVRAQVKDMARGQAQPDLAMIRRYVDGEIYELTSRANIKAILEPSGNPNLAAARAIEVATANLLEPLTSARSNNNREFLNAYNQVLVASLPKLLNNHLLARTEAMIVLGNTRSPRAIDIFIQQLGDPNQTVWVKLWAAKGLANVTQDGRIDLDTQQAMKAGKAVADFLEREEDLPWPVQVRALEALGALRESSSAPLQGKADMASAALERLADPKARPEVRAWAAWALGLMRVNPQFAKYNFSLIAYYIGQVAAELGEQISEAVTENPEQARFWTGLLLYQLHPALAGQPEVRDSGLLNLPNIGTHRPFIQQVSDRVQAIGVASVQLMQSAGGQIPVRKKELMERVGALKAFLAKAVPSDRRLLPGGPEFPLANSQVAGAR